MHPPRGLGRRYLGYGQLLIAVLTAAVVALAGLSVTHINQAAYSGLSGNKIAMQAQEYALSKAEFVRAVNYDDLTAQSRSLISDSVNFYDEVIIGAETDYPDGEDIKQRICTVNVYKDAEALPRYSLRVTRLSASQSGGTGVPQGTILPWYGNTSNIPFGFALCDGSNGTPDLRNKFLVGAGSTYVLGATGGSDSVTLTAEYMPNHVHGTGWHSDNNSGRWFSTGTSGKTVNLDSTYNTHTRYWNGSGSSDTLSAISGTYSNVTIFTSLPINSSTPASAHENRPPYYALYYIMKL